MIAITIPASTKITIATWVQIQMGDTQAARVGRGMRVSAGDIA